MTALSVRIGVLALQGAFIEHLLLLQRATAQILAPSRPLGLPPPDTTAPAPIPQLEIALIEVRTAADLAPCHALIIPGGESTSISLIAERTGLLEPLREFVKVRRRPTWGTCAGLILLAESANKSKQTGQELIGGLDVRVHRNYFGRQVESFEADLDLPFLGRGSAPFHSVFIRAPVVEQILSPPPPTNAVAVARDGEPGVVTAPSKQATTAKVEVLGRLPGRASAIRDKALTAQHLGEEGDIIAVRQGNVFATAFHPELTDDARIHVWWLQEVLRQVIPGEQDWAENTSSASTIPSC